MGLVSTSQSSPLLGVDVSALPRHWKHGLSFWNRTQDLQPAEPLIL